MGIWEDARIIWDYHHVGHTLDPADCVIVLGSHDPRVAERGARLYLEGLAPLLVFTGNVGSLTRGVFPRPEAELFAEVAAALGVPRERMLLERQATHTGENVELTRRLLNERGIVVRSAIAVQKPYMERRTLATFEQRWPELRVQVTSPPLDFDAYPNREISREDVVHIMVGDLQRLWLYAARGWSTSQAIPDQVLSAYRRLVAAGYTRHLVRED